MVYLQILLQLLNILKKRKEKDTVHMRFLVMLQEF